MHLYVLICNLCLFEMTIKYELLISLLNLLIYRVRIATPSILALRVNTPTHAHNKIYANMYVYLYNYIYNRTINNAPMRKSAIDPKGDGHKS